MDLYDFRIDNSALQSQYDNPENKKYYQTLTGLLNQTYQGFPLMASKTHFLDSDKKWPKLIKMTDEKGNRLEANQWDDTRLYIEPYTGTAFSATISLQSNYYYIPDILFPDIEKTNNTRQ